MHRVGRTYILTLALFLTGVALQVSPAAGLAPQWLGTAILASAMLPSLVGTTLEKRYAQVLAQTLRAAAESGAAPAAQPDPALPQSDLARAANELVTAAQKTAADARLRARELEIQLKIATAERQHAEAILYSISDAVLVTDPFGDLVLANDSAARAFQFDLARAQHSPLEQALADPRIVELMREMRQGGSQAGRRVVEHQVGKAGHARTFKVTLSSIAHAEDLRSTVEAEPCGVVAVLHDMTHEKEVAQMKNDFVSSVSHELRTPLASIKAYVELLIDGEADDEQTKREFYDVIQNEANRLGRLIDNILNISRIESGLVKVDKQPQSLTVIVKDALEVIAPQAAQKQLKLVEELTPVFYQTLADRDMLYQAVLNLLSNAVKYTPEGGQITVQIATDDAQKKVYTRIIDNGVGIPPKDLPFVFDKFYRSSANCRMASGTGLGLSLVKHIVETVHHGRMTLESEVGKGSSFGFELALCD